MKTFAILLLFLVSCSVMLCAQRENNIWCFGYRGGLDFNGGTPVLTPSKSNSAEGSASVCNKAGNLLFYIGRDTIWNRNHQYMPYGTGISGNTTGSSHRGVGIVQSPSDTAKYYVFMIDEFEHASHNTYYSIVDMNLDGGLGDVVPGQKNIILDTNTVEGISLMPMAGCNGHWLVLHQKGNTEYRAFRIDAGGIASSPVISQGLLPANAYAGVHFMPNNNGNGIAGVVYPFTELGSFDNSTGLFSNFKIIDTALNFPTFSPDDSRLYARNSHGLYQFDLSLMPNTAAVLGSMTLIDTGNYLGSRVGPDQKLYLARFSIAPLGVIMSLARIPNPNAAGAAVSIERSFIPSLNGVATLELGCPAAVLPSLDTSYSHKDTVVCQAASVTLTGDPGYEGYFWSTGGTAQQETFSQPGTYWLQGRKRCTTFIDTFRVAFRNLEQPLLGPDTAICPGDTFVLTPSLPDVDYQWQDGSHAATFTIKQPGVYSVTAIALPCRYQDTIRVTLLQPFANILQADTTICKGTPLSLRATASPGSELLWNTGEQGNTIEVTESGSYVLTATNACGTLMDSVRITVEDCICNPFVPNAFSPNGDGKNDQLKVFLNCPGTTGYQFSVYNRYGQRVFRGRAPSDAWNGETNGHTADQGTYFYYLQYKNGEGVMIKRKGDITLLR
ncbi:gliding motility-associated C-terminal domain-containing protein [Taibaiella koreensis]|uniref:gliding motility-associated C-terminal domain-containing protein n=1 Tax=Taibaiella koreensis TaxID=1268548 RepID=UPI000E59A5C4|nr:gliding motility-associated C-terminal domain-containing protein [Taibaiella koreensis]